MIQDSYEEEGEGVTIEPFNLKQEREEGYFDADGNYVEYRNDNNVKVYLRTTTIIIECLFLVSNMTCYFLSGCLVRYCTGGYDFGCKAHETICQRGGRTNLIIQGPSSYQAKDRRCSSSWRNGALFV